MYGIWKGWWNCVYYKPHHQRINHQDDVRTEKMSKGGVIMVRAFSTHHHATDSYFCRCFSPLLREVFFRVFRFFTPPKPTTQFEPATRKHLVSSCFWEFSDVSGLILLHLHFPLTCRKHYLPLGQLAVSACCNLSVQAWQRGSWQQYFSQMLALLIMVLPFIDMTWKLKNTSPRRSVRFILREELQVW